MSLAVVVQLGQLLPVTRYGDYGELVHETLPDVATPEPKHISNVRAKRKVKVVTLCYRRRYIEEKCVFVIVFVIVQVLANAVKLVDDVYAGLVVAFWRFAKVG